MKISYTPIPQCYQKLCKIEKAGSWLCTFCNSLEMTKNQDLSGCIICWSELVEFDDVAHDRLLVQTTVVL
jgi:hypothetical protein